MCFLCSTRRDLSVLKRNKSKEEEEEGNVVPGTLRLEEDLVIAKHYSLSAEDDFLASILLHKN